MDKPKTSIRRKAAIVVVLSAAFTVLIAGYLYFVFSNIEIKVGPYAFRTGVFSPENNPKVWKQMVRDRYPDIGDIDDLSDKRAIFSVRSTGKSGLLGPNGKIAVAPNYSMIWRQRNGYFMVVQDLGTGLIDRDGKRVIKPDPEIETATVTDDGGIKIKYRNGEIRLLKIEELQPGP